MKDYKEMAECVFKRAEAVKAKQQKTRKKAFWILPCLLAAVVAAAALGRNHDPVQPLPGQAYLSTTEISCDYSGLSSQYIAGPARPVSGSVVDQSASNGSNFQFHYGYIHVVARAAEVLPEEYRPVGEQGSLVNSGYTLIKMEVLDPLHSGMEGSFYYLLPSYHQVDLTKYDKLLMSIAQLPYNFILQAEDRYVAFEYLFYAPYDLAELGNIIAYNTKLGGDILEDSLWQEMSIKRNAYQLYLHELEQENTIFPASNGRTLKSALRKIEATYASWGEWASFSLIRHTKYTDPQAQSAMAYITPFKNGIFVPVSNSSSYQAYRYIHGCPTNEWISINRQEQVSRSKYRFSQEEIEALPDLSQYIDQLDLQKLQPQHTDTAGKVLGSCSAIGWYEKKGNEIYSIVRISWTYFGEEVIKQKYYDETFLLVDETGETIISREELIELIGKNDRIYQESYGVGIPQYYVVDQDAQ